MKNLNYVRLHDAMGHGLFSAVCAEMNNAAYLVAIPQKDTPEEYKAAQEATLKNINFFKRAYKVKFEDSDKIPYWDPVAELTAGRFDNSLWDKFARTRLVPQEDTTDLPRFWELNGKNNLLWIPQKYLTDGACGLSAGQQSVPLEAFEFLKGLTGINLVFGQHFSKVNDLGNVKKVCAEFNAYLPGQTEHPEVLGIRGVQHKLYYHMYRRLKASIGIAGTHTWYMLTMFPGIPQIILYNKKGVERWDLIGQAYRDAGYRIYPLGFDETTDFAEFSKEMEILLNNIIL